MAGGREVQWGRTAWPYFHEMSARIRGQLQDNQKIWQAIRRGPRISPWHSHSACASWLSGTLAVRKIWLGETVSNRSFTEEQIESGESDYEELGGSAVMHLFCSSLPGAGQGRQAARSIISGVARNSRHARHGNSAGSSQ